MEVLYKYQDKWQQLSNAQEKNILKIFKVFFEMQKLEATYFFMLHKVSWFPRPPLVEHASLSEDLTCRETCRRTMLQGGIAANRNTYVVDCFLDLWPGNSYVPDYSTY